jgi:pyruvate formate-lyase activating enzyme-like uncharacterized protein
VSLEKSIVIHTNKTTVLSEKLNTLSADVDTVKREIDKKGSSITDTSPVVEIRTALQLLKEENKELDVRIGVLVSKSFKFSTWTYLSLSLSRV